jgi:Putative prokaryotic signal transducing protein
VTKIDRSKELRRLKALYAGMEDSELAALGAEPASLTEIAHQALNEELAHRSMEPLPPVAAAEQKTATDAIPPEPVMVRRYRDLPQASIAKSILESAGIESFLVDDNLVRLDWFYSNLVGGIKLFVRQQDAEASLELLEQGVPENFDVEGLGEYRQPRCPQCQSFEVSFDGLNKPASYATLWFGLPIPITNAGWKCRSCGHSWQENSVLPASKSED